MNTYSFRGHVEGGSQFVNLVTAEIRSLDELPLQRAHLNGREGYAWIAVTVP